MRELGPLHWEMFLRGAVAALLAAHVLVLLLPGPRPAVRRVLAGFATSVLAYLFCQQAELLLNLPRVLAVVLLAFAVGSTGWLWAAAQALFVDGFRAGARVLGPVAALTALGLAANLPYFPSGDGPYRSFPPDAPVVWLGRLHGLAMLGFTAAALWEVLAGAPADLVAARRSARRWVALGIGLYAAFALVVELALRGQAVGPLLPALHVAGIGLIALALAAWVARHSLDELLGIEPDRRAVPPAPPDTAPHAPTPSPPKPADRQAAALARLDAAMRDECVYRREGLTLAGLADTLGMAEAPLRELINQRLGFRNFNDFLHHHRLGEATRRLAEEDLPILSIALDCGYGSIGPFNRAFRQRLGMTPTDYRAAARMGQAPCWP